MTKKVEHPPAKLSARPEAKEHQKRASRKSTAASKPPDVFTSLGKLGSDVFDAVTYTPKKFIMTGVWIAGAAVHPVKNALGVEKKVELTERFNALVLTSHNFLTGKTSPLIGFDARNKILWKISTCSPKNFAEVERLVAHYESIEQFEAYRERLAMKLQSASELFAHAPELITSHADQPRGYFYRALQQLTTADDYQRWKAGHAQDAKRFEEVAALFFEDPLLAKGAKVEDVLTRFAGGAHLASMESFEASKKGSTAFDKAMAEAAALTGIAEIAEVLTSAEMKDLPPEKRHTILSHMRAQNTLSHGPAELDPVFGTLLITAPDTLTHDAAMVLLRRLSNDHANAYARQSDKAEQEGLAPKGSLSAPEFHVHPTIKGLVNGKDLQRTIGVGFENQSRESLTQVAEENIKMFAAMEEESTHMNEPSAPFVQAQSEWRGVLKLAKEGKTAEARAKASYLREIWHQKDKVERTKMRNYKLAPKYVILDAMDHMAESCAKIAVSAAVGNVVGALARAAFTLVGASETVAVGAGAWANAAGFSASSRKLDHQAMWDSKLGVGWNVAKWGFEITSTRALFKMLEVAANGVNAVYFGEGASAEGIAMAVKAMKPADRIAYQASQFLAEMVGLSAHTGLAGTVQLNAEAGRVEFNPKAILAAAENFPEESIKLIGIKLGLMGTHPVTEMINAGVSKVVAKRYIAKDATLTAKTAKIMDRFVGVKTPREHLALTRELLKVSKQRARLYDTMASQGIIPKASAESARVFVENTKKALEQAIKGKKKGRLAHKLGLFANTVIRAPLYLLGITGMPGGMGPGRSHVTDSEIVTSSEYRSLTGHGIDSREAIDLIRTLDILEGESGSLEGQSFIRWAGAKPDKAIVRAIVALREAGLSAEHVSTTLKRIADTAGLDAIDHLPSAFKTLLNVGMDAGSAYNTLIDGIEQRPSHLTVMRAINITQGLSKFEGAGFDAEVVRLCIDHLSLDNSFFRYSAKYLEVLYKLFPSVDMNLADIPLRRNTIMKQFFKSDYDDFRGRTRAGAEMFTALIDLCVEARLRAKFSDGANLTSMDLDLERNRVVKDVLKNGLGVTFTPKGQIAVDSQHGVLVIRPTQMEDYAQLLKTRGDLGRHLPAGVFLPRTGLGIPLIMISPDNTMFAVGTIRHELQHLRKAETNHLELGRAFPPRPDVDYRDALSNYFFSLAKDEALAFLVGGTPPSDTVHFLTDPGGSYDYIERVRNNIDITAYHNSVQGTKAASALADREQVISELQERHRSTVTENIWAMHEVVVDLEDHGYHPETARQVLVDKLTPIPFSKWPEKLPVVRNELLAQLSQSSPTVEAFDERRFELRRWLEMEVFTDTAKGKLKIQNFMAEQERLLETIHSELQQPINSTRLQELKRSFQLDAHGVLQLREIIDWMRSEFRGRCSVLEKRLPKNSSEYEKSRDRLNVIGEMARFTEGFSHLLSDISRLSTQIDNLMLIRTAQSQHLVRDSVGKVLSESPPAEYPVIRVIDEVVMTPGERILDRNRKVIKTMKQATTVEELVRGIDYQAASSDKSIIGKHVATDTLFIAAKKLDYSVLENLGLKAVQREDSGRMTMFYVDAAGVEVVKKVHDGFAIMLAYNAKLINALATTGHQKATTPKSDTEPPSPSERGGGGAPLMLAAHLPAIIDGATHMIKGAAPAMSRAARKLGQFARSVNMGMMAFMGIVGMPGGGGMGKSTSLGAGEPESGAKLSDQDVKALVAEIAVKVSMSTTVISEVLPKLLDRGLSPEKAVETFVDVVWGGEEGQQAIEILPKLLDKGLSLEDAKDLLDEVSSQINVEYEYGAFITLPDVLDALTTRGLSPKAAAVFLADLASETRDRHVFDTSGNLCLLLNRGLSPSVAAKLLIKHEENKRANGNVIDVIKTLRSNIFDSLISQTLPPDVAAELIGKIVEKTGKAADAAFEVLPELLTKGLTPDDTVEFLGRIAEKTGKFASSAYKTLPKAFDSLIAKGLSFNAAAELLGKVAEKAGWLVSSAYTALPKAFDALTAKGLSSDAAVELLGKVAEETGDNSSSAYKALPRAFDSLTANGLSPKAAAELLGKVAEKVGWHAPSAYTTLPVLLEKGLSPDVAAKLLGKIAEETGDAVPTVYTALPTLLTRSLSPEGAAKLIGKIAEKAGRNASSAFEILPKLLDNGLSPERAATLLDNVTEKTRLTAQSDLKVLPVIFSQLTAKGVSPENVADLLAVVAGKTGIPAEIELVAEGLDVSDITDWARTALPRQKIAPEWADTIYSEMKRRDVGVSLLLHLFELSHQSPGKLSAVTGQSSKALSRFLLADMLGIDATHLTAEIKYADRSLADFYESALHLQQGLHEPVFKDTHLDPRFFRDKNLTDITALIHGLDRLKGLDSHAMKNIIGGQTISPENIKAVTIPIEKAFLDLFNQRFQLGSKVVTMDQVNDLVRHWGNLDVLYTLVGRYSGKAQWKDEVPFLGLIAEAVLAHKFTKSKYNGFEGDLQDQRKAAAQTAMLADKKSRAGWMENYSRVGVFRSGGQSTQLTPEALFDRSQELLRSQVLGHLAEMLEHKTVDLVLAGEIRQDVEREPKTPTVLKYKREPAALARALFDLLNAATTPQQYQHVLGLIRANRSTLKLSPEVENGVTDLDKALRYVDTGKDAIVFTTTTDDPKLLLMTGDLVDATSCQNYRIGSHIETLPGYVIDANVKLVLSFALTQKDFGTDVTKYHNVRDLVAAGAKVQFIPSRMQLQIGDVTIDLPKAFKRRVIKLGATSDGNAGLVMERAYQQNHIADGMMTRQLEEVFEEQARNVRAATDQEITIPESRNPGGVYSDAAAGVMKGKYEIQPEAKYKTAPAAGGAGFGAPLMLAAYLPDIIDGATHMIKGAAPAISRAARKLGQFARSVNMGMMTFLGIVGMPGGGGGVGKTPGQWVRDELYSPGKYEQGRVNKNTLVKEIQELPEQFLSRMTPDLSLKQLHELHSEWKRKSDHYRTIVSTMAALAKENGLTESDAAVREAWAQEARRALDLDMYGFKKGELDEYGAVCERDEDGEVDEKIERAIGKSLNRMIRKYEEHEAKTVAVDKFPDIARGARDEVFRPEYPSAQTEPFGFSQDYRDLTPLDAEIEAGRLRRHFAVSHEATALRAIRQFDELVRMGKLNSTQILNGADDLAAAIQKAPDLIKFVNKFLKVDIANSDHSIQMKGKIAAALITRVVSEKSSGSGGGSGGMSTASFMGLQPLWEGARNVFVKHAAPKLGRAARSVAGAMKGWFASGISLVRGLLPAPKVESQDLTPSPLEEKIDAPKPLEPPAVAATPVLTDIIGTNTTSFMGMGAMWEGVVRLYGYAAPKVGRSLANAVALIVEGAGYFFDPEGTRQLKGNRQLGNSKTKAQRALLKQGVHPNSVETTINMIARRPFASSAFETLVALLNRRLSPKKAEDLIHVVYLKKLFDGQRHLCEALLEALPAAVDSLTTKGLSLEAAVDLVAKVIKTSDAEEILETLKILPNTILSLEIRGFSTGRAADFLVDLTGKTYPSVLSSFKILPALLNRGLTPKKAADLINRNLKINPDDTYVRRTDLLKMLPHTIDSLKTKGLSQEKAAELIIKIVDVNNGQYMHKTLELLPAIVGALKNKGLSPDEAADFLVDFDKKTRQHDRLPTYDALAAVLDRDLSSEQAKEIVIETVVRFKCREALEALPKLLDNGSLPTAVVDYLAAVAKRSPSFPASAFKVLGALLDRDLSPEEAIHFIDTFNNKNERAMGYFTPDLLSERSFGPLAELLHEDLSPDAAAELIEKIIKKTGFVCYTEALRILKFIPSSNYGKYLKFLSQLDPHSRHNVLIVMLSTFEHWSRTGTWPRPSDPAAHSAKLLSQEPSAKPSELPLPQKPADIVAADDGPVFSGALMMVMVAPKVWDVVKTVGGAIRGFFTSSRKALPPPKVKSQDLTPSPAEGQVGRVAGGSHGVVATRGGKTVFAVLPQAADTVARDVPRYPGIEYRWTRGQLEVRANKGTIAIETDGVSRPVRTEAWHTVRYGDTLIIGEERLLITQTPKEPASASPAPPKEFTGTPELWKDIQTYGPEMQTFLSIGRTPFDSLSFMLRFRFNRVPVDESGHFYEEGEAKPQDVDYVDQKADPRHRKLFEGLVNILRRQLERGEAVIDPDSKQPVTREELERIVRERRLTPEALDAARRAYVFSDDVRAAIEKSPHKSARDLFVTKVQEVARNPEAADIQALTMIGELFNYMLREEIGWGSALRDPETGAHLFASGLQQWVNQKIGADNFLTMQLANKVRAETTHEAAQDLWGSLDALNEDASRTIAVDAHGFKVVGGQKKAYYTTGEYKMRLAIIRGEVRRRLAEGRTISMPDGKPLRSIEEFDRLVTDRLESARSMRDTQKFNTPPEPVRPPVQKFPEPLPHVAQDMRTHLRPFVDVVLAQARAPELDTLLQDLSVMDEGRPPDPKALEDTWKGTKTPSGYKLYNNPDTGMTRVIDPSDAHARWQKEFTDGVQKMLLSGIDDRYPAKEDGSYYIPAIGGWYWGGDFGREHGEDGLSPWQGRIFFSVGSDYDLRHDMPKGAVLYATLTKMAHDLRKQGVSIEFKVAAQRSGRSDAGVLYFEAKDEAIIHDWMVRISRLGIMRDRLPLFVAPLTDAEGRALPGIGFAQHPESGDSFGMVRVRALQHVWRRLIEEAKGGVVRPRAEVEGILARTLVDAGVDPDIPAFERGGAEEFPHLRQHMLFSPGGEMPTQQVAPPKPGTPR